MRDPDFTLSAGPVTVSPRVLAALGSPIVYHYDPVFLERFRATERKLAQVFLTTNDVLLMQGEAVLGLEAATRGLVQPGTKVLNLVQGVFGKGMGYWLKDFGAELHELEVPYNDAVDPAEVERYLDDHPGIELVTVVHSETPSGTVCDVSAIGPIAHSHGALTLIDCVSSLGGIPLKTDEWHLDVCVAGAQKCLGGPPGMSLMTVSDAAWERVRANPSAPRASYLSMLDWKEQWIDGEKFPFTPSVSDLYGVEAAVDELLEEGLEASIERHEQSAAACRAGVRAMGLELWPRSDEIAAACVTAIAVPEGLADLQVRAHCRERYGVMISGGQGAGNLVRIAHMGLSARSLHPVVGLAAVGRTLADLGAQVEIGPAVEAALAELSQVKHRGKGQASGVSLSVDKPAAYPLPS
jgi:pyridoxamine--pyruvate transaminase